MITPPVALAAYAGSAIAKSDPMKTGIASVKLAIAGFIVPFMFVYSPQLMLINTSLLEGIWVTVTACVGVFLIAVGFEGYFLAPVALWLRAIVTVGALGLMMPGVMTDAVGAACLVGLWFIQSQKAKSLGIED